MDREGEEPYLTRNEVVGLLHDARKALGNWSKVARHVGCNRENLSKSLRGGPIPLAVIEYFDLERLEVRTIVYRRKK